jgi:hypothetical protein
MNFLWLFEASLKKGTRSLTTYRKLQLPNYQLTKRFPIVPDLFSIDYFFITHSEFLAAPQIHCFLNELNLSLPFFVKADFLTQV